MSTVITPFQGTDSFSTATFNNRISQINTGFSYISNPNLLDNWYFGNPVDQRQGYVVLPDKPYYKVWGGEITGRTNGYYSAKQAANQVSGVYEISIDGNTYYVGNWDCVRGYTGSAQGIDRWNLLNIQFAVTIENDGITLHRNGGDQWIYAQPLEPEFVTALTGKSVVISTLTDAGLVEFQVSSAFTAEQSVVSTSGTCIWLSTSGHLFLGTTTDSVKLKAAKLELGSQQTLAHQENGVWVLNEIPDYADTLARCQYYSDLPTTWTPMTFYVADFICFTVKTHREMRVNLSSSNVTLDFSKLEVHSNGAAQSGFTFSVYGGGDDFILVKAAKSGHGLSNAMLIVNNGGIYANANM